nr:probable mediator of RNA polymerase II transcription subunit 26B isoform X2 [Ipomoea batatas]
MDCPSEFRLRMYRITEVLFSCKATRCSECKNVELAFPNEMKRVRNFIYGDAEEESLTVREALRIKGILDNYEEKSDSILFTSLRMLQLMNISVETLEATKIVESVTCLHKHGSVQIKHLAWTLIKDWKVMVDEWIQATAADITGSFLYNCFNGVITEVKDLRCGFSSSEIGSGKEETTGSLLRSINILSFAYSSCHLPIIKSSHQEKVGFRNQSGSSKIKLRSIPIIRRGYHRARGHGLPQSKEFKLRRDRIAEMQSHEVQQR